MKFSGYTYFDWDLFGLRLYNTTRVLFIKKYIYNIAINVYFLISDIKDTTSKEKQNIVKIIQFCEHNIGNRKKRFNKYHKAKKGKKIRTWKIFYHYKKVFEKNLKNDKQEKWPTRK